MLVARFDKSYKREQALHKHSMNVAEVTGASLEPYGLKSFGQVLGWLHDLCKSTLAWQLAIEAEKAKYLLMGKEHHRKPLDVPHAPPAAHLIYRLLLDKADNSSSGLALQMLCMAVHAHHGYLMDALTPNGDDRYKKEICEREVENAEGVERFYDEVISKQEIFALWELAKIEVVQMVKKVKAACSYIDKSNRKIMDSNRWFMLGMMTRLAYSALIDADRLDAANFESGIYEPSVEKKAPDWRVFQKLLENRIEQFDQTKHIFQMRNKISLACAEAAVWEENVQKLHAPTGGGKTLASLRWALVRSALKKRRKIYYIVSYTTILDQVHGDYINLFKDHKELDILLHHSNIIPDESIEKGDVDENSVNEERQLRLAERWDSDIILTTQVQFFNALFLGAGKAARRMKAMNNAVIIFDEVQTIPVPLTHLFNMAIAWLTGVCHCDVLLSTATQPTLSRLEYPMPEARNIFSHPDDLFKAMKRVVIYDERKRGPMNAAEIAKFVYEKQKEHTSVLVVLNTRTAARKVYDALMHLEIPDVPLFLLSNNMCVAHRKDVIDDLKKLEGQPSVCISTQLIECGVDLSFGCAVRSFAGADSIWQTAGRCNRHGNPEEGTKPVYIILCAEENLVHLKDIERAQLACETVLHHQKEADHLQLPLTMNQYYEYYYLEQVGNLSFNVSKNGGDIRHNTTIVDMLSVNKTGNEVYEENNGKRSNMFLKQAFATAGKKFSVIDSETVSLIVPYKRGEEIISELSGGPSMEREKVLLKEAQLYAINVFRYHLDYLGSAAVKTLGCGANVLRAEWYDGKKRGLLMDPECDPDKYTDK